MMMNENKVVESVSESYDDSENVFAGKKPRSRERGPDKKPRTYRANSIKNFVQFKERPKKFAKYLNDEKGIDITGNSGIVKVLLIFGGAMIAIFGEYAGCTIITKMGTTTVQKADTDIRRAVVTDCFSDIFYQLGINSVSEIINSVE